MAAGARKRKKDTGFSDAGKRMAKKGTVGSFTAF